MATLQLSIDGKAYRMACADGQEAHLERLAAKLDQKVGEMRQAFGEIGDMRLTIMAAITIADELTELQAKLDDTDRRVARLERDLAAAGDQRQAGEDQAAEAIRLLSRRVAALAANLGGAPAGG
jgi:cell division protein ZapA